MAFKLPGKLTDLLPGGKSSEAPSRGRTTALVTGSIALGALLTGAVMERTRRTRLPLPPHLAPALGAPVHEMKLPEGKARFYKRDGEGLPIVLLHSINAAGSSYEMKPLFDHWAARTGRPIYALDWFGFGLSDRPAVSYRPGLYQRQLRRFLHEHVRAEADVVAYSLGCEYAAAIANAYPAYLRKLVLIAPTALGRDYESSAAGRALLGAVRGVGAFDVLFGRISSRENIARFYREQVFSPTAEVPPDLINYAFLTSHTRGAQHAPSRFIEGSLFMNEYAWRAYTQLTHPTLLVTPTEAGVQRFDRAAALQQANPGAVERASLATGLMPQWEQPDALFAALDPFLDVPPAPREAAPEAEAPAEVPAPEAAPARREAAPPEASSRPRRSDLR